MRSMSDQAAGQARACKRSETQGMRRRGRALSASLRLMRSFPASVYGVRVVRIVLFLAASFAVLAWFYFFDPAEADAFLPCPFRLATGWSCPGCGTQRAMHLFLHGDFLAAVHSNPLSLILIPVVAFLFTRHFAGSASRGGRTSNRMRASYIAGMLVLLAAYWIARNMPWWPWT
jgi:hypothetical protein